MADDSFAVKRTIPRITLVAAAEVVERGAGTRLNVRISEISARGCYVDTLNPFDIGTQVDLRISHGNNTCDAHGKVIYSHAGYGMGVLFVDLPAEQRAILDGWLNEMSGQTS